MAVLGELDFLHTGSEVPRHVSKETERENERALGESHVTLSYSEKSQNTTSATCHWEEVSKSPCGFDMRRNTGPTCGGRQEGWEIYVDVAIFGIYSLPQCKEVGK